MCLAWIAPRWTCRCFFPPRLNHRCPTLPRRVTGKLYQFARPTDSTQLISRSNHDEQCSVRMRGAVGFPSVDFESKATNWSFLGFRRISFGPAGPARLDRPRLAVRAKAVMPVLCPHRPPWPDDPVDYSHRTEILAAQHSALGWEIVNSQDCLRQIVGRGMKKSLVRVRRLLA
jgi:hypothetical protein